MNRRNVLRLFPATAGWLGFRSTAAARAVGRQDDPRPEADQKEGEGEREPEIVSAPPVERLRTPRLIIGAPSFPAVGAVALSPDHSLIAAADGRILHTYDAEAGRLLLAFEAHDYPIGGILFSPDGSRIATGSPSRLIMSEGGFGKTGFYAGALWKVWETNTRDPLGELIPTEKIGGAHAFLSNDRLLFLGSEGLTTWDIATDELDTQQWPELEGGEDRWSREDAAFSADAQRVAAIFGGPHREGRRGEMRRKPYALGLWDVAADRSHVVYNLEDRLGLDLEDRLGYSLRKIALSPDGRHVAISSWGRRGKDPRASAEFQEHITLLDFDNGAVIRHFQTRPETLFNFHFLAFGPDGTRVVSGSNDRSTPGRDAILRLWDTESGQEIEAVQMSPGTVSAVAFLSKERLRIVSVGIERLRNDKGSILSTKRLNVWEVEVPPS